MPARTHPLLLDAHSLATLAWRGRVTVWLMLAVSSLATVTDMLTHEPLRDVLVLEGVVRAVILMACVAVLSRANTERWIVATTVGAVSFVIATGLIFGMLRSEISTALMVASTLCIGVAAFLPWGAKMQLVPVATAAGGVFGVQLVHGWNTIAPQPMALTLGCIGLSLYFAHDHGLTRRSLADYEKSIERSRAKIRELTGSLEQRIATRSTILEETTASLAHYCRALAADLRPALESLHEHLEALELRTAAEPSVEAEQLSERIGRATVQMGKTLDLLLHYLTLGSSAVRYQSLDVSALALNHIERLRSAEPNRVVNARIGAGITVDADFEQFDELLGHLIENAWKFSGPREQASIEVTAEVIARQQTSIRLRDNGIGINMAHAEKLFRPFSKLEQVEIFPGHGMGLACAQRIVTNHHGRIDIRSAPDSGCEILISLPTVLPTGRQESTPTT